MPGIADAQGSQQPASGGQFSGEAVLQILRLIFAGAPLQEVLTGIGRMVEEQEDGLSCTIWLLDDDERHVHCVAAPSLPGFVGNVGRMAVSPRGASCGAAVYWRRPVYARDILTDPIWEDYRDWLSPYDIRAAWSWPVVSSRGIVLGTFAILSRERGEPSLRHVGLIDAASRIVGIATERHHYEQERREREIDFRRLVNSVPAPTLILTAGGAVEVANQAFLDAFRNLSDSIVGSVDRNWIHPADRIRFESELAAALATTMPYEGEIRQRLANGLYRWAQVRGYPLPDRSGRVRRWLLLIIDIDDRKHAEAALAVSERSLAEIVNCIPALAWSARVDGSTDFVNQHYLDYLGLSPQDARDWGWSAAVHPDDLETLNARWRSALESGEREEIEARLRRYDGVFRWFLCRTIPLRDEDGTVVKWFGVNTDIDDRKRAEDAHAASERNLSLIVNTMPGLASVASPDGRLEFLNRNYMDYLGVSEHEVRRLNWDAVVHPDDVEVLVEMGRLAASTGAALEAEARLLRSDGAFRWFLCRNAALRDETGAVTKWFGVAIDIEERKRAEESLRSLYAQLTRMSAVLTLAQLTASVAHELNQPLSGIVTNASAGVRMLLATPPQVQAALTTAQRTIRDAHRASEIISRLRALFDGKPPALAPLDLNEATREVIALASSRLKAREVSLRQELAETLPIVEGDRVQIQQVIFNLLQNAMDALDTVADRPKLIRIRTDDEMCDHVRLTVSDTGIGFDRNDEARVFEPFFTTKAEGMGIGLSISRTIIERHGGKLWATQNEGSGATFTLIIPLTQADVIPADDRAIVSAANPPPRIWDL